MFSKAKKSIYRLFDDKRDWFDYIILALVIVNVIFMALETLPNLKKQYHLLFDGFEVFAIVIFTIEYILRVFTITENPRYRHPVKGRLKYMTSFMGIIDLCSFAFFWLRYVGLSITSLQIFQTLRLLKIVRYIDSFKVIIEVLKEKKKILIGGMGIVLFIMIISSVVMYQLEHEAQPDKFSSIPQSMYWSIITMTSVGYGDISPITKIGQIAGSLVAVLGICAFAIPVGAIASGFLDYKSDKVVETSTEKTNVKHTKQPHDSTV